ncbi:MAG: nucleotide exchange factor GrpE [Patescibacteria group bacterium]
MLKNFSNSSSDKNQAGDLATDLNNQTDELGTLKKQAEDYLAGWRRAQADYSNLKKETERQQIALAKFANSELILEILPVLDYFKQALKSVPPEQVDLPWVKGISLIQDKLWQVLSGHGLKEIESAGKPFDPLYHEAIQDLVVEGQPSGLVAEEIRPGYLLHDKVLQPAQVKVTK